MPTYTYECSNPECGDRWEETRDRNDPNLDQSTQRRCGRRVFAPGDVRSIFKGRGWARKDHKDASKP